MKKIVLSIGLLSSLLLADGSMEAMDKYNLAYADDRSDYSVKQSKEESSFSTDVFDYFMDREKEKGGFYFGLGYGDLEFKNDVTGEAVSADTLMIQTGYQFNQYVALEGRYYWGIGDPSYDSGSLNPINGFSGDLDAWGAYVKPSFPLGPLKFYGLIGYGSVSTTLYTNNVYVDGDDTGMQYGGGINFYITKNFIISADYLVLYDDSSFDNYSRGDFNSNVMSFALTYKF